MRFTSKVSATCLNYIRLKTTRIKENKRSKFDQNLDLS